MSEAVRLLGECTKRVDDLTSELDMVSNRLADANHELKEAKTELTDWKNDAEGHRKANESLQRRVEELERSCKDLSEEVNDMNRVRRLLDQASIHIPDNMVIQEGTVLSSRVRIALEDKEAADKREFDLMKFLNQVAVGQLKDTAEATPAAIAMLKSYLEEEAKLAAEKKDGE